MPGIPPGKMLRSSPFEHGGGKLVMDNSGLGLKDSFAVYTYSMGGPGGIPLAVKRSGQWVRYLNTKMPIPEQEARKYEQVSRTIQAKNYGRIVKKTVGIL